MTKTHSYINIQHNNIHSYNDNFKSIKNFLNRNYQKINQLQSLNTQNSFERAISKVNSLIHQVINSIFGDYNKNLKDQTLRSQEQLMRSGSIVTPHQKAFSEMLSQKNSPSFQGLRQEIDSLTIHRFFDKTKDWPGDQKNKLRQLKVGESVWINVGTRDHSMIMRVTKEEKEGQISYKIQHANTGAGIEEIRNGHQKVVLPNNKVFYQTVIEYPPIDEQKLLNSSFFEDLESELMNDKISKKNQKTGDYGEALAPINAIYSTYRQHLGEAIPMPYSKGSEYYSKPQIGGSCTPSSMWALARTVLSPEEYKELRQDLRMEALVKSYSEIINGWETSSTAKIIVLDNIQRIKGSLAKHNQEIPSVFLKIEKEFLKDLNMKDIEMKRDYPAFDFHYHRRSISQVPTDVFLSVKPMEITPTAQEHSLKYQIKIKPKQGQAIPYELSRDPNHPERLRGKDGCDALYLLYYHIASGNDSSINHHLESIRSLLKKEVENNFKIQSNQEKIEKIKKERNQIVSENLSLRSDPEGNKVRLKENSSLITDLNEREKFLRGEIVELKKNNYFSDNKAKMEQTAWLFAKLANEIGDIDRTKSGVAKAYLLANIALLMDKDDDLYKQIEENIKGSYYNLDVEFYLSEDNRWLQGLQQFNIPSTTATAA